jgi:hypothetical protein
MIITKCVSIKMNGKHIQNYRNKGYICNVGETIEVDIEDIPKLSSIKIEVKCDVCGTQKITFMNSYSRSIENGGYYACGRICSDKKNKKTNLIKYGVENYNNVKKRKTTNLIKYGVDSYIKTEECKNKIKETNLEKYGCENVFQNGEIKNKIKETNLEKYGCENVFQNGEIKNKIKETNLEKYGCEHNTQRQDVINKIAETNLMKYGYKNVLQNEEIKNKIKETNLEKYGVNYAFQSKIIKDKIKKTNLEKYGYENASKNKSIKLKIKNARVKNGSWISDDYKTEFEIYENIVDRLTKNNKKILFENWDGYDYYDNEYIKENLKLGHHNKKYPTIDHKISKFYGFCNNISPEEIANINNLCITKFTINSSKNKLTDKEFKQNKN